MNFPNYVNFRPFIDSTIVHIYRFFILILTTSGFQFNSQDLLSNLTAKNFKLQTINDLNCFQCFLFNIEWLSTLRTCFLHQPSHLSSSYAKNSTNQWCQSTLEALFKHDFTDITSYSTPTRLFIPLFIYNINSKSALHFSFIFISSLYKQTW